jgi:hypothetical protein
MLLTIFYYSFIYIDNLYIIPLGNAWNNEERVVAVGYDDGEVKLFDLKAMSILSELTISSGVFIEKVFFIKHYFFSS